MPGARVDPMISWSGYVKEGHIPSWLVKEKPIIALYGCFQTGKSTLINCLLGRYVALTGNGLATTALTARYRYGTDEKTQYRRVDGSLSDITLEELNNKSSLSDVCSDGSFHIEARVPGDILEHCDIVDTPGFNSTNEEDTAVALGALENIHYCLFVIPNDGLQNKDQEMLKMLSSRGVPISVIMNCRKYDTWLPSHPLNQEILSENQSWLVNNNINLLPLGGKKIFPCNALFYWSQQADFEKSKAFVDKRGTLQKRIRKFLVDEDENYSAESVVALSEVPTLIESLKAKIRAYDPVTHSWRSD